MARLEVERSTFNVQQFFPPPQSHLLSSLPRPSPPLFLRLQDVAVAVSLATDEFFFFFFFFIVFSSVY